MAKKPKIAVHRSDQLRLKVPWNNDFNCLQNARNIWENI